MQEQEYERKKRRLLRRLGRGRRVLPGFWWLQRLRWWWHDVKREARDNNAQT